MPRSENLKNLGKRLSLPKVSVCIPTYNYGNFLSHAIDSVLNQTFTDYELIICDNASIDDTEEIVKSYSDRRIRYFRNSTNLGSTKNFNKCIEKSTGKYVYILHADDVMLPENLDEKVRILDSNPSVGLVHSNYYVINASGKNLRESLILEETSTKQMIEDGLSVFRRLITGGDFICAPTVMVKRECYNKVGYFNPTLLYSPDWEMWMRIALEYDIAYIPTPLIIRRLHKEQATHRYHGKLFDSIEEFHLKKNMLEQIKNRINDYEKLREKVLYNAAMRAIKKVIGNYPHSAFGYLFLAVTNCPRIVRDAPLILVKIHRYIEQAKQRKKVDTTFQLASRYLIELVLKRARYAI